MMLRRSGPAAAVFGLCLIAVACSSGGGRHASLLTKPTAVARRGARFDELRLVTSPTNVDYLDPALAYAATSWTSLWRVYIGLLTYRAVVGPRGAMLVPGLADALPQISNHGRTYRLRLRTGLRYSDATAVRASDFKYAIKRLFLMNSPGVGFFSDIVGADVFAHTKRGDIRGILVNDAARTIEFDLKRPRADFPNILALPFATAVPAGTPAADRSTHPIPSTGPYTLAHYTPQVRFTLVRNPYFVPTRSIPRGNPDRVTVEIVGDDSRALQEVIRNAADDDLESIPTDRLKEVQSRFADRLRFSTLPTTIYFALNTRTPPFTDVRVRRAVNYAIDRRAIVTLLGGLATPTENLLPPTYPAYRQLWLYPYDRARARQLIASAHADGNEVGVWGPSAPSVSEQIVLYAADSLRKIGLRPRIHLLGGAVYWAVIGNQRTRAQMVSAGWAADYPQPLDWFDHQLNGANITANHNTNYANANDPQINRLIEKLKRKPRLTPAINNAWAKVDRLVQERAFLVPLANPLGTHFFSRRIDERCFVDHVVYGFDWSQICVR